MNKQSKITIKHYLETKGNHISLNGGKIGFPLYCQVTYQRKTTKFRSFTGAVMTEKGYTEFCQESNINREEVFVPYLNINKEIKLLELSIRNIIAETTDLNVFDKSFLYELKKYFEPIKSRLLKVGWFFFHSVDLSEDEIKHKKTYTASDIFKLKSTEEDIRIHQLYKNSDETMNHKRFYQAFNQENTLLENIYRINTVLKTDIKPYFFDGTLLYWEVIELVLIYYKDITTIEFLENFNENDLHVFSKKLKLQVKKEEISKVCKVLKDSVLSLE